MEWSHVPAISEFLNIWLQMSKHGIKAKKFWQFCVMGRKQVDLGPSLDYASCVIVSLVIFNILDPVNLISKINRIGLVELSSYSRIVWLYLRLIFLYLNGLRLFWYQTTFPLGIYTFLGSATQGLEEVQSLDYF